MDAAGFDAVLIRGRSHRPTVVSISPEGGGFHDGRLLWGMDTYQAEAEIVKGFGRLDSGFQKSGAVVIGPAGERLVRFAVMENDHWRSAGRTGVGTVMGSKQLKGILFQGNRSRLPFDGSAVKAFAKAALEEGKDSPGATAYRRSGTPMMVRVMNRRGAFPARYWSQGTCAHWERISAEALHSRCKVQPRACAKCFMACGRMTFVLEGRHAGLRLEGPEYETIYVFGGLCMIDSIEEIVYLNDLCDRLGMDTISAGNLCAFAIEASRRGAVPDKLEYGNADQVADLLHRIARLEGIGGILARGILPAAEAWGLEDLAVHVKGMEPAGYDPRVLKGMGLAYAVSDRGACHLRTTFYKPELAGMIDPNQIEGKARLLIDFEDRLTLFDSLILCRFYRDLYPWEALLTMVRGLTGLDLDQSALQDIASNIASLVRRFNVREGLTPEDDKLPAGLHRKLAPDGGVITPEELAAMRRDYYALRG